MSQKRLILHVGAPKCGSTALQSAFAHAATFRASGGEEFNYAVIDDSANLHSGAGVRRRAIRSLSDGARCASAARIGAAPEAARATLTIQINEMLSRTSVILSNEGWLSKPDDFNAIGLLSALNAPVDVVAYVRPQPDYINAAWWQWGAWTGLDFNDWVTRHLDESRWGYWLGRWGQLPQVQRVDVRLLPADVVADFFSLLGCTPPQSSLANPSLPAEALRLMQTNPHLRAGPHDSNMPFVLGRALQRGSVTPWILKPEFVARVIDQVQSENRALQAMLDPEAQARMTADERWWRVQAYADKSLAPIEPPQPNAKDLESLAVDLALRLLSVERELRALKAREAS